MIIGEYQQKVSDKKRIAFPKKFRNEMGDELIISKGYEGCLVVMSPKQWELTVNNEISGPFVSGLVRDTSRFLLASANEIALDDQGRFVIPKFLVEYSKIADEGVFLGLSRWVELWGKEQWDQKRKEIEDSSSIISEKLSSLGTNGSE